MNKVDSVLCFIRSLDDFVIEKSPVPNGHMGATIADAVLQAGFAFDTVVRPRVDELLRHPEARSTSGFLKMLRCQGAEVVSRWKGKKVQTVLEVVRLLSVEHIETVEALKVWLEDRVNCDKLTQVKGIGPKSADYLKILAGIETVAPDRHLTEFLRRAGIEADYQAARSLLGEAAKRLQMRPSQIDYSIWKYVSEEPKSSRKRCSG